MMFPLNSIHHTLKACLRVFVLLTILLGSVISFPALSSGEAQAAPLIGAAYPQSSVISSVSFDWSSHQELAPGSDNWPVTWADDGHQYTTWGDGGGFGGTNDNGRVSLGFGRVEGDSSSYRGVNIWGGVNAAASAQFTGKSYGILSIGSRLYAWRCGDASTTTAYKFQQLYESTDRGLSWNYTGVEYTQSSFGTTRGFFCPTFLQFGQGYSGARDGYVYMYASELKSDSWQVMKPGEVSLMRVSSGSLKDRSQYQFYAGTDGSGSPTWTNDASQRRPVFADGTNGVFLASAVYNAGLKRYLLVVEHTATAKGNIGIYDAPNPWGPWTTVLFENGWGAQVGTASTFFWNFSNKWTSSDGKDFVLVFTGTSGNDSWNTVRGRFTVSGSTPPTTPPPTTTTPAPTATTPAPTSPPPTATQPPSENDFAARVNFQPASAPVPSGFVSDSGGAYGSRNGYTYGWTVDNGANVRDRNSSLSPDESYDTLNHLQKDGQEFVWEMELPNGEYKVRIVAGDASHIDSTYRIEAEGVLVVNGTPSDGSRWLDGAATVSVSDGRLTLRSGSGAVNNKINFIEVVSLGLSGYQPVFNYHIYLPNMQR